VRTIDFIRYKPGSATAQTQAPVSIPLGDELRRHLELCREILAVVEHENQDLRRSDSFDVKAQANTRKNLLERLRTSLDQLRRHRQAWQQLSPAERARSSEVVPLLRQNQDLIMKIVVLDRENEQILLRRGLLPPQHLPPAQRQRAHFVADLYRQGAKFS
jgi:hypothetical protein